MAMHQRVALLLCIVLGLLLGAQGKDEPDIKETPFPDIPVGLFYFEDSDVAFVTDPASRTIYRTEDAGVNWKALDVGKGKIFEVLKHPHNNQVSVVIGTEGEHWITKDQGKSWKKWECQGPPTMAAPAISFHATDPDRMLYHTSTCQHTSCEQRVYYTTDGFASDPKKLRDDAFLCIWVKSSDHFTSGDENRLKNGILCVVKGAFDPLANSYRLVSSDDFFRTEDEPIQHEGRAVSGILSLAAVKAYIVAAAKSEGTSELALYVTTTGQLWNRAVFSDHKLEEDAYTILESTNYSMQVDVLTTKPSNPMGVLLTSNYEGNHFTKNIEHTNRDTRGFVDFEKMQNIQGIVFSNIVDNWEEVEQNWIIDKKVKSRISFDDGQTFHSLRVGDDDLHLHSVTDQRNMGRIFSTPAPGIVMGIGNTGEYLHSREEGDLYVSDDAGVTWRKAQSHPHLFEIGDQGAILVAIEDAETNKIKWSLNHGEDWEDVKLEDDIQPIALTTVPDSTSLKFILTATKGRGSDRKFFLYSLDFRALDAKKCSKDDFEDWWARTDKDGKPTCIMGHTQKFRRRKKGKKCFVGEKFKDPKPIAEDCKCTDNDYECDFEKGFTMQDEDCKPNGPIKAPEGACYGDATKFLGPSGYRRIPGNTCVKEGGVDKEKQVERECKEIKEPVASGKITSKITRFTGKDFIEYYYRERKDSNEGDDETVIMRTNDREVYVTHDHGKQWEQVTATSEVVAIYPHQYINEYVYLITPGDTVWYSKDRAHSWNSFKAPDPPNQDHIQILSFHPNQKDWLMWTGARDCDSGGNCQTIARVSTKGGDDWQKLLSGVRKCQFVYREGRTDSDQLVYCEQYVDEDRHNSLSLLSSTDWFEHKNELKRDVINFATMSEFIVVAVRDADQQSLQVDTSIDGKVFADAKFPPNFEVDHQRAYTVLDSSTHAVFLHVTVNSRQDSEYGSIIKSNSNGTSYVLMVNEVNRNEQGYVDFEKMQGLEGVAVINRVANVKDADEGMRKKLKTYMTHNDGADWALIGRPGNEPSYNPWCKDKKEKCSLHLHGYTERKDPRDTFSSPSAVGLMLATGNVGEFLDSKNKADTFITRDGGVSWNYVAPGSWMWEYGDQGSIIVIVAEDVPTGSILYTLDEGDNWLSYTFSEQEMVVSDISTLPSDSSRNFLLWGKLNGELTTVNIDFSGLEARSKQCKLDEQNPRGPESDYKLWSPAHPNSNDKCLFGHVAQYHRKKTDRDCYNGRDVGHLHNIKDNCTCTLKDFECDYNYERQSDGSCKLVKGLKPADAKDACKTPGVKEYYDITGYRRIPITTCQGGKEMDYTADVHPCPGYEDEFAQRHGLSGLGIFFAIVIPVIAAAGIGYWVYSNWEGKFGRIRLGDDGANPLAPSTSHGAFDRDAPWIKYPIMAVSGIVAVVAVIPVAVGSLWKMASTRLGRSRGRGGLSRPYTSRSSFGRGRGTGGYAVVAEDEGELLGEDSDDDI